MKLSSGDRRLLLGYGPLAAMIVAFLLMAVLAPTVAPQRDVATVTAGQPGQASPAIAGGSAGPGPGSAGPDAAGLAGRVQPATNGLPVTGQTGPCAGQAQQVPGDPYSPPCTAFHGDNGGATSRGVTADTITIAYRIPADPVQNYQQAIEQLASKYGKTQYLDTTADVTRTLNDLVTYFNTHFQFYGRKLKLVQYQGQGQLAQEILGGGQAAANADGIRVAQQLNAFADISALSQPYAEALSTQRVVNIGAPYLSQQWFDARAPYAWSLEPDCTELSEFYAEAAAKGILGHPAAYAGGGLKDKPRRIGLIAPDNAEYQQCVAAGEKRLESQGLHVTDTISYSLDLGSLSSQAASIVSRLKADGITSVACACDPVLPIFLTAKADQQSYVPEWLVMGTALTDYDPIAQLYDQKEWSHAFGGSALGAQQPFGSSYGYFAAKAADPGAEPAHIVDLLYYQLYLLAAGVQEAGPGLTAASFMQGMLAYPGGNGPAGLWKFGPGQFTPQRAGKFVWWDPNRVSVVDGAAGSYVDASPYYRLGQIPPGPMPVFPSGVQSPNAGNSGVTNPSGSP